MNASAAEKQHGSHHSVAPAQFWTRPCLLGSLGAPLLLSIPLDARNGQVRFEE